MIAKEIIDELSTHENKVVLNKINIIDTENEEFDIDSKFEIFNIEQGDAFIQVVHTIERDKIDIENSIYNFLNDYDNIKIELDLNNGIFIFDNNDGLIREIEFKPEYKTKRRDIRVKEMLLKLINIL